MSRTPDSGHPLEPVYRYALARALRPQEWLRVALPLLLPDIDKAPKKRLALDMGDGRTIVLYVVADTLEHHISCFRQVERLLCSGSDCDPVPIFADELRRLCRGDGAYPDVL